PRRPGQVLSQPTPAMRLSRHCQSCVRLHCSGARHTNSSTVQDDSRRQLAMTDPGGPIHIFNLALSHLMIGVEVQTWSDPSKEAATLRRYYPTARRKVLRDFPWPFATKIVPLALVSGSPTAPASTEYTYAYRT